MFDWTVLNLQNERARPGVASDRPVSVPREEQRESTGAGAAAAPAVAPGRSAAVDGGVSGLAGETRECTSGLVYCTRDLWQAHAIVRDVLEAKLGM